MHLQYLAHLGDPDIETTLRQFMNTDRACVRFGCAKAALERGHRSLFREVVSKEPPGRYQRTMLKLVRSRKKRDYTDQVMRIHDHEFDTPGMTWSVRDGSPH
jgi:hypothetical protein